MRVFLLLLTTLWYADAACTKWYKIKEDDTYYNIALRSSDLVLTAEKLDDLNRKHVHQDQLQVDHVICVEENHEDHERCTKSYTVKRGDNCWAIAEAHRLTMRQFFTLNRSLKKSCHIRYHPKMEVCVQGPYTPKSVLILDDDDY